MYKFLVYLSFLFACANTTFCAASDAYRADQTDGRSAPGGPDATDSKADADAPVVSAYSNKSGARRPYPGASMNQRPGPGGNAPVCIKDNRKRSQVFNFKKLFPGQDRPKYYKE